MCCCCCPPAITALFCLWVQSGFSKGTVAGALTFFPPDPPLYTFQRLDENGNVLPDTEDDEDDDRQDGDEETTNNDSNKKDDKKKKKKGNKSNKKSSSSSAGEEGSTANTSNGGGGGAGTDDQEQLREGAYRPTEGQSREKVKSPAQQLTDRAKELRIRAKKRNARDAADDKKKVVYKLILDPRLSTPRFQGSLIEAVKVKTKTGAYVAAVIYKVPEANVTAKTKTLIYSHGNATDVGAMFPLQAILSHSLECNVVSYDYSGYGESGGIPMEKNTYTDAQAVLDYTIEHICGKDPSKVVLYGQSVGSGPCCYLGCREDDLGGMVLHSPFLSGMRVLTPSRALACLDIYPNIDRIRKVKCPVMVIHGRLDEEVDVSHGVAMHQAVPNHFKRDPWWVPDRGHNDITEGPGKLAEYIGRLRDFLESLD